MNDVDQPIMDLFNAFENLKLAPIIGDIVGLKRPCSFF